mmetsp:Transcript_24875/g.42322  ORF Transcript_24875/g.42322 Transcript_24875/m.42322 type:complete len:444 (-) Transcript_24875:1021-2352(-)
MIGNVKAASSSPTRRRRRSRHQRCAKRSFFMPGRNDFCGSRWGTSFGAKQWLVLDPCGMICLSISFGIHAYATTISGLFLVSHSLFAQIIYYGIYLPLTLLAVASLYMAWRTDPGSVPMGARPLTTIKKAGKETITKPSRAIRRCAKCNDNFKPARAHHDSVSGRCVVKMDHFCPWVCNVVGALNHKFFVLFISYTLLCCLLTVSLIVIRFIRCGYENGEDSNSADPSSAPQSKEADWVSPKSSKAGGTEDPNRFLAEHFSYPGCDNLHTNFFVIALAFVAIAFMIFTCCMLCEQLEAIETNTGKIARMKLKIGRGGTELERVTHECNEMFGGTSKQPAWHWFLPLPVRFPDGLEKVILGYDWDPTFGDEPFQEDDMVAAITRTSNNNDDDDTQEVAVVDALESGTTTTEETDESFLTTAKKRGRKAEDNPVFVIDKSKNRLT